MSQFDKHVLERSAALSEFAHRPMTFDGETENLFANVSTRFDPQGEFLPIVLTISDYVSNARNFPQLLLAIVVANLRFKFYSTGLPDFSQ
jgi:hypothetical protein